MNRIRDAIGLCQDLGERFMRWYRNVIALYIHYRRVCKNNPLRSLCRVIF